MALARALLAVGCVVIALPLSARELDREALERAFHVQAAATVCVRRQAADVGNQRCDPVSELSAEVTRRCEKELQSLRDEVHLGTITADELAELIAGFHENTTLLIEMAQEGRADCES